MEKKRMDMSKDKKEHYLAGYTYEEWEKLEKEFLNDYEKSTVYNKSFGELISEILECETYMSFAEKTHLSENMMTQALLYSLGLGFNRFSKRDYAYTFLLTRCRGKTIDECNQILEKLGIEQKYWLGSYAKRKSAK